MRTRFNRMSTIVFVLVCSLTLHAQEVKTITDIDASAETVYFNLAAGK